MIQKNPLKILHTRLICQLCGLMGIVGVVLGLYLLKLDLAAGGSRAGLGWLASWGFWAAILIGALFLTQISYVFDAGWSVLVRRQWEHLLSGFGLLGVLLAVLIIMPFCFGEHPGLIWNWMHPELHVPGNHGAVGADPLYLHKAAYLNIGFFVLRLLLCFVIFCTLAGILRRASFALDASAKTAYWLRCRRTSAVGIFLTSAAASFMAFDLFMSLSYHWFSTIYGVWLFATSMRLTLALTVLVCNAMAFGGSLRGLFSVHHNYFLGCLMLGFTVFWAYISFSQYFLIYNANIPEETIWYNIRALNAEGLKSSWWWVSMALVFCYFLVPFLALLFYKTKVVRWRIMAVSVWILAFGFLDFAFNIMPFKEAADNVLGYTVRGFSIKLVDIAAFAGIGGLMLYSMLRSSLTYSSVPLGDPRVRESLRAVE